MMAENLYDKFNIKNHNARSYYIMGCCGPFGILDIEHPEKISFLLLHLDNQIILKQKDGVNCGVIWCLFIYDLMQQAFTLFDFELDKKKKRNVLPIKIGIGKTWIQPSVFSGYLNSAKEQPKSKNELNQVLHEIALFKLFRKEIVVCLEQLRYLCLENRAKNDEIEKPEN